MKDWLKYEAWPWVRDIGLPSIGDGCKAWFTQTFDHPGVAVFNIILGAIVASLIQF